MSPEPATDIDTPLRVAQEKPVRRLGSWEQRLWLSVGAGLGLCSLGLFALVGYSLWQTLGWLRQPNGAGDQFLLNAVALISTGILKYLAMLIGAAIASGGLLVSFLTISQAISASASKGSKESGIFGEFKTSSPGVVAIVIGCVIIVSALYKRTELEITSGATPQRGQQRVAGANGPMPDIDSLRKEIESTTAPASGVSK